MTKIARKSAKVFGSNAGAQQVAQFGSLAVSSIAYSTDPAVIQSLAGWQTGWFGATVGGNSPAIEDENAVDYVHSYQIGYLMQTGIPEYDAGTTYYTGSMVQDGNGNVRVSQTNANVGNGNLLTDGTNWRTPAGHVPVGAVVATFPNLTGAYSTVATTAADAAGWVLCGGQTIADATSPMSGQVVPNINNSVFIMGSTTAGATGGSNTAAVAAHTHAFTSTTSVAAVSHTHNFAHNHQWGYIDFSGGTLNGQSGSSNATTTFTTGTGEIIADLSTLNNGTGTAVNNILIGAGASAHLYTGGPLSAPTGSGSSAATGTESADTTVSGTTNSTGTATDSRPAYISAVFLMRIR